jgi:hypothetical protein
MDGIGALRGLIGKSGSIPARSRHCNEEQTHFYATEMKILGRYGLAMIQSQENCLYSNHRYDLREMGRGFTHMLKKMKNKMRFPLMKWW